MSFDGFFTRQMLNELKEQLVGGRVSRVFQPFEQEIHLVIRSKRQNHRLVASIHPTYYRLHLSQERPANPTHAPMFAMLLRKHLENASLLDIQQIGNDRVVRLIFSGRDELGDLKSYHLMIELMGRHSNIVLVDPKREIIIDCIKHVPASLNSYRTLQAGADYRLPPSQATQTNITTLSAYDLKQWCHLHAESLAAGEGFRIIQGLSKLAAQEIAHTIHTKKISAYDAVQDFLEKLAVGPGVMIEADKPVFYAFDLSYIAGERTAFDNLSALVDAYYAHRVHTDRIKQMTGNIIHQLEQIIARNQTKLEHLAKDRQIAENSETYRIYGELLSAYAHEVEKGQAMVTLPNYYEENAPLDIPLDPAKSPIENSQSHFKKYSKYRDSLKYIDKETAKARQEIAYLESVLVQIAQADIEDIEDIKQELREEGYQAQKHGQTKKRSKTSSKPRRYRSSDGVMIYVGRNNHQNDELSLKRASKNHWWLHTKNIPGSHVIVESDRPSEQTMLEAAEIAAYHSKSQYSANVPVDTVQVKHLRKPNGAKPGFVIYEGQQTLYVTPVESAIKAKEVTDN